MNPPSEDIKDMLVAESDLGLVFATNLFIGKEPDSPDDCVTIFDTYGFPPMMVLEGSGNYFYPAINIRVRSHQYLQGIELAQNIVKALHGRYGETWNGAVYTSIVCQNDPGLLDWDENNRVRFVVNFNIQRKEE